MFYVASLLSKYMIMNCMNCQMEQITLARSVTTGFVSKVTFARVTSTKASENEKSAGYFDINVNKMQLHHLHINMTFSN